MITFFLSNIAMHRRFAHGPEDLRCFSDCPTYKTKVRAQINLTSVDTFGLHCLIYVSMQLQLCKEEDSSGGCPYIHATGECFYLHRVRNLVSTVHQIVRAACSAKFD